MRILIAWISPMLNSAGGAEKVIVNLANEMQRRGHRCTIMYCTEKEGKLFFPLDKDVKLLNLLWFSQDRKFESLSMSMKQKLFREIWRAFDKRRVKNLNTKFWIEKLRTAVEALLNQENPDVILTVDYRTNSVFGSANKKWQFPIIGMNHANAENVLKHISTIELNTWNNCDVVQVLMGKDKSILQEWLHNTRIVQIVNSVPQNQIENWRKRDFLIIHIARIEPVIKRQHLLIEAFAKVSYQFPQWKLELWGKEQNGDKYTHKLQELIQKYRLKDRVKLCGNTNDVCSIYRRASIFAFPSASEGFPLAMTEAMSAGLPIVAYRSCPAVNELVRDGKSGLLVDDGVDALAEGLKKLMEDQALRERMGGVAHESMKEFAPEKIWDQWESLMQDVIAKHKAKMEH